MTEACSFSNYKHLFINNLDKMNVKRAIQIFSKSMTASLETSLKVDPHAFKDHDSMIAAIHFMEMFSCWFDFLNISNRTHGYHNHNDVLLAFLSESDERLDWLKCEFLPYIESIQAVATDKTEASAVKLFMH